MDETNEGMEDPLKAWFIIEGKYTTWLSNVVLVNISNNLSGGCVSIIWTWQSLSQRTYLLNNMNMLVNNSFGFKLLSFMNTYLRYN